MKSTKKSYSFSITAYSLIQPHGAALLEIFDKMRGKSNQNTRGNMGDKDYPAEDRNVIQCEYNYDTGTSQYYGRIVSFCKNSE